VVRLAYAVHASEQHLRQLLQAHDQLRFELAVLKEPERIYRIATEQLGMRVPQPEQVIFVTRESQGQ
jgi:cell division protein FtsL